MEEKNFNLFVYGSLRDRRIFKSVCGLSFGHKPAQAKKDMLPAEPALLAGYKRVSPDNVYFYGVKSPHSTIEGVVIHNVPEHAMNEIDRYEGKRFKRETVSVNTASGSVRAYAYLVSRESMKKLFGDRWHVNLIHELWLRKRIEKFLKKHTRPGERSKDAELERIADRELLAATERDLVISHYRSDAVSDYFLEHELDRPRPSIKKLYDETGAVPFIKNYLVLVIRQVLLNQLDEKFQSKYRFELEHIRTSERYFKRTISLLSSLRIINENKQTVDLIVRQGLERMPFKNNDIIDYVKYAVGAARDLFDSRVAASQLDFIRSHFSPGLTPLGAELEFSNLGVNAVAGNQEGEQKKDIVFDGFRYFYDFCLDILCWKLGGYIDDHSGSTEMARRCGFLEMAPGRLNIKGEISRPATADPWTLNLLINEIVRFYEVKPHSLHLSFQLRKNQINNQKILTLDFVKCLLALGGGLEKNKNGSLSLSRIANREIIQSQPSEELVFASTSSRRFFWGQDSIAEKLPPQVTSSVQQYKYIRLEKDANYEPLILCLKGLQLSYNPGDYLTAEQLAQSSVLRSEYEELKSWAVNPSQIDAQTIDKFLDVVEQGLLTERHRKPAHQLHYIDWALAAIETQLNLFNREIKKSQHKS